MRIEVTGEPDVDDIGHNWQVSSEDKADVTSSKVLTPPRILTVDDLRALKVDASEMLFDGMPIPTRGASLVVGGPKAAKPYLPCSKPPRWPAA